MDIPQHDKTLYGEVEQDEPKASGDQKPAQLPLRLPLTLQPGRQSRQEHKGRSAEMSDPPGEIQRRIAGGGVKGIAGSREVKEVPGMIQGHNDHDDPSDEIDGLDAAAGSRRGRGKSCRRLHRTR